MIAFRLARLIFGELSGLSLQAEAAVLATYCRIQWSGIGIQSLRMVLSLGKNGSPFKWWARQGSNLRPIGYEPTALPLSYRPTNGESRK